MCHYWVLPARLERDWALGTAWGQVLMRGRRKAHSEDTKMWFTHCGSSCTSAIAASTRKSYLPPAGSSLVPSQPITIVSVSHPALKHGVGSACLSVLVRMHCPRSCVTTQHCFHLFVWVTLSGCMVIFQHLNIIILAPECDKKKQWELSSENAAVNGHHPTVFAHPFLA